MYAWAIFIHLIFAAFWLGGMLFTAAVLVPATRKKLASQRGKLFTELGTRFSRLSWVAFPILILTGVTALLGKGYSWPYLLSAPFWESIYGRSEEHTSELQSRGHLVCRLLLEKHNYL